MNTYDLVSIYHVVIVLIAIAIVMLVFSMWQLRNKSNHPDKNKNE